MSPDETDEIKRPKTIYVASYLIGGSGVFLLFYAAYLATQEDPPELAGISVILGCFFAAQSVILLLITYPIYKGSIPSSVVAIVYGFIVAFSPVLLGLSVYWEVPEFFLTSLTFGVTVIILLSTPSSWRFSRQGKGRRLYRKAFTEEPD